MQTDASPSAPAGAAPVAAPSITIKNYSYVVQHSVKPGARVMVKNDDQVAHTVTADSNAEFDVTIQGGTTASFIAPNMPGSYKFHCNFHANMHGTLVVS